MIYIDTECKCHNSNPDGAFRGFDVPFFHGKCTEFIEGYVFVPFGESIVQNDGVVLYGETIFPFKDYSELDKAQREYEKQLLADYESALAEIEAALGV